MYSLCGISWLYNNYYNKKLYKFVKTCCQWVGGCKIVSLSKICNDEVKILNYTIKLLK